MLINVKKYLRLEIIFTFAKIITRYEINSIKLTKN